MAGWNGIRGDAIEKSQAPDDGCINLLKPTGYVTHQQFNFQQLYALPTLYLCFVFI